MNCCPADAFKTALAAAALVAVLLALLFFFGSFSFGLLSFLGSFLSPFGLPVPVRCQKPAHTQPDAQATRTRARTRTHAAPDTQTHSHTGARAHTRTRTSLGASMWVLIACMHEMHCSVVLERLHQAVAATYMVAGHG